MLLVDPSSILYAAVMAYAPYTNDENSWTWKHRTSDTTHTGRLELIWEITSAPLTGDHSPHETSAHEVLDEWLRQLPDERTEQLFGPGATRISWGVGQEHAPFQLLRLGSANSDEDFLTHFTWPTHPKSNERVNFNRLPVQDKRWDTQGGRDDCGFIQEATGWKPSPLQPVMWVGPILAAAGLDGPVWEPRWISLEF